MNPAHNIYIHVPFCISKCKYCAFFSHACATPDWSTYADGIIREITDWRINLGQISVPTIFFGGGTPSLMPVKVFERIMQALHNNFHIVPNAEITLESNPGTLDSQKLKEFQAAGVNRLSVGVQSFDDGRLEFLGRRHSANDAINLINCATNNGLSVSGDFIYGLPYDTVGDVIKTCHQINNIGLRHCSMYELTIEPNTPFGKMNLNMPSNDTMADMYMAISDTLQIPRYEVSNYATPSDECRHNKNIWDGDPYIGIGAGAAGRIYMNGNWYEQRGNSAQFDILDINTRATEMVLTGLRQIRGMKITPDILRVIDMDWVNNNPKFIRTTPDNRLAMTDAGIIILDELITQLIK